MSEYVLPRLMAFMRRLSEESKLGRSLIRRHGGNFKPLSPYEEQAMLEPHEGCFSEYLFLMTQLGYVTFFAPAVAYKCSPWRAHTPQVRDALCARLPHRGRRVLLFVHG